MPNQFEKFIQNVLSNKYDIHFNAIKDFNPQAENEEEILKSLNICFLILLSGNKNSSYKAAKEFLNKIKKDKRFSLFVDFYSNGTKLVSDEINALSKKDIAFNENIEELNKLSSESHNYEQIVDHFWSVFFPEGNNLLSAESRKEKVSQLRLLRKVDIIEPNKFPIKNPSKELLFTSNILLTKALDKNNEGVLNLSENLKNKLNNIDNENQKYWYDHPIPLGIPIEQNEIIYGLSGLSKMLQFEKEKGNAQKDEKLNCVLSVSVTHEGLHTIAKEYIDNQIKKSKEIKDLNIFIFTENETHHITEDILKPIAKKYLDCNNEDLENINSIFGVDGEYGRHYSFLKAIAAIWHVFIDEKIKGTFKIDLDQVFPNEELVTQSGASVFDHFKSSLWGAKGRDAHGNTVDLSMIAGALVNNADIEKSLFYPDIRFPTNNQVKDDEYIFNSKWPQALSTEAEMMEKYKSDQIDGENSVISRVHVTGGTNGILIKALRTYRPFTPSFIGRAEDQAYLMSVLFEGSSFLRYLHKSGLIMRHDKQSFAGEAIQAAETGKIIGDYIRILIFSHYAKNLPWSINRIKSELDPFTGCFISNMPFTVVYLRFIFMINSLFNSDNVKDSEKAKEIMYTGIPRLQKIAIDFEENESDFRQNYLNEAKGWNLFYDILDIAEKKLKEDDEWMMNIKAKLKLIVQKTEVN